MEQSSWSRQYLAKVYENIPRLPMELLPQENVTVSYPQPDEHISYFPTLISSLKIIISKYTATLKVALAFVYSTNMIGSS
jgi:hypothetical protein